MMQDTKTKDGATPDNGKTSYSNAGFFGRVLPGCHRPCKIDKVTIYHDNDNPRVCITMQSLSQVKLSHNETRDVIKKKNIELRNVNHIRIVLDVFSGRHSPRDGFEELCKVEGDRAKARKTDIGILLLTFVSRQSVPLLDSSICASLTKWLAEQSAAEKTASSSYKMARL